MQDQLTVRFPRELTRALKERAARMQRKPSEVVRMAVREFLETPEPSARAPSRRLKELVGSLDSGVPDMAVRHREYMLRKLRRGR